MGNEKTKMIAEVIFGYLWWSVFQAMPGVLWFYPLCLMKVSGLEILGLLWMSPVLMKFTTVRHFVTKPFGLMIVRMLTMIGVGSYLSSSTILHVLLISIGNFFAMLALAGTLWDKFNKDRYQRGYLHMMGYLLYLAVRVWGSSFNYIFMNTSLNMVALCVGLVASMVMYSCSTVASSHSLTDSSEKKSTASPGLVATSIGFGSLMFLTSFLFSEVSIITRWAVAPHPLSGPQPHPWGMATLLALTMGLVLFGNQVDLLTSVPWLIVGIFFSMILYFGETYQAFFGGLIFAVYTASLWPLILKRIVGFPPHKVFTVAMTTYFFYLLLSVWVVAYNFVPGGMYTRERTDVLLIMLVLSCGMGTCRFTLGHAQASTTRKLLERREIAATAKTINFIGRVFRRLSTIEEDPEKEENEPSLLKYQDVHNVQTQQMVERNDLDKFNRTFLRGTLLILILALLGYAWRYQPPYPTPTKEQPRVFSAGIWAFHFGYDNLGWPSMERAAQLIEDAEVDVIGLLETDAARPYIGSHDIASWLGERLHMHVDYGPGTKEHTWGTMLLSKYPIVRSQHLMLPSPEGEIAPAILATIDIFGELVDFYAVHFGNDVDELDRRLQAQRSVQILANSTHPVVMLSYITTKPGTKDYNAITRVVKDVDPSDKKRFCEYIFYSNLTRVAYARISNGGLSDTEMQIGKFMIQDPALHQDWNFTTFDPKAVPSWMHFPNKFGGHWATHYADQSRHHFHMDTPKYFKLQN